MTGIVTQFDARAGHGLVSLTRGVRRGARRCFPFAADDVKGGTPQVGQRLELSIVWPSTGQPFAADVLIVSQVVQMPTIASRGGSRPR